jgi:hypothetical protein
LYEELVEMARRAAVSAGISPDIFVAMINQESGFNPQALSHAGAGGIAQFMPFWVAEGEADWRWDPAIALPRSANVIAGYVQNYRGDYRLALAAYNAGPGAVSQYGGIPPYAETQNYVSSIMAAAPHAFAAAGQYQGYAPGGSFPSGTFGSGQEMPQRILRRASQKLSPAAKTKFSSSFAPPSLAPPSLAPPSLAPPSLAPPPLQGRQSFYDPNNMFGQLGQRSVMAHGQGDDGTVGQYDTIPPGGDIDPTNPDNPDTDIPGSQGTALKWWHIQTGSYQGHMKDSATLIAEWEAAHKDMHPIIGTWMLSSAKPPYHELPPGWETYLFNPQPLDQISASSNIPSIRLSTAPPSPDKEPPPPDVEPAKGPSDQEKELMVEQIMDLAEAWAPLELKRDSTAWAAYLDYIRDQVTMGVGVGIESHMGDMFFRIGDMEISMADQLMVWAAELGRSHPKWQNIVEEGYIGAGYSKLFGSPSGRKNVVAFLGQISNILIAGGDMPVERIEAEMKAQGFSFAAQQYIRSWYKLKGVDNGFLQGQGLDALEIAQKNLLELQAEDLAIRIENGGATPFMIKEHEEQVNQFNQTIQLNRRIEDRVARGERINQFLFAESSIASMAGTLVPVSSVGKPLGGFEEGGYLHTVLGDQFTPSVIEARTIAPALMSLAGGSNLQAGDVTDRSTRTWIDTTASPASKGADPEYLHPDGTFNTEKWDRDYPDAKG